MPEWALPVLIALGGGAGLGGLITAIVNARGAAFNQLQTLYQAGVEERKADRADHAETNKRVDGLYVHLGAWRNYGNEWEDWHAAGCPDPPGRPVRPGNIIIT